MDGQHGRPFAMRLKKPAAFIQPNEPQITLVLNQKKSVITSKVIKTVGDATLTARSLRSSVDTGHDLPSVSAGTNGSAKKSLKALGAAPDFDKGTKVAASKPNLNKVNVSAKISKPSTKGPELSKAAKRNRARKQATASTSTTKVLPPYPYHKIHLAKGCWCTDYGVEHEEVVSDEEDCPYEEESVGDVPKWYARRYLSADEVKSRIRYSW